MAITNDCAHFRPPKICNCRDRCKIVVDSNTSSDRMTAKRDARDRRLRAIWSPTALKTAAAAAAVAARFDVADEAERLKTISAKTAGNVSRRRRQRRRGIKSATTLVGRRSRLMLAQRARRRKFDCRLSTEIAASGGRKLWSVASFFGLGNGRARGSSAQMCNGALGGDRGGATWRRPNGGECQAAASGVARCQRRPAARTSPIRADFCRRHRRREQRAASPSS